MNNYTTGRVCNLCGALTQDSAIVCPHCGTALPARKPQVDEPLVSPVSAQTPTFSLDELGEREPVAAGRIVLVAPAKHNPTIAVVISAIVPGLGQIYNRQTAKGIMIMVAVGAPSLFIQIDLSNPLNSLIKFAPIFLAVAILSSASVYDAFRVAQKLKSGASIGPWQTF